MGCVCLACPVCVTVTLTVTLHAGKLVMTNMVSKAMLYNSPQTLSSTFPAGSLSFTIIGEMLTCMNIFCSTIEGATFCAQMVPAGCFLLLACSCLGHGCQDLFSLCKGTDMHRLDFHLYSQLVAGSAVRTRVNSQVENAVNWTAPRRGQLMFSASCRTVSPTHDQPSCSSPNFPQMYTLYIQNATKWTNQNKNVNNIFLPSHFTKLSKQSRDVATVLLSQTIPLPLKTEY